MKYPKYRHFKARDLAFVELAGKRHYLGKYDSPESRTEYQRILNELHLKQHGTVPTTSVFDAQQPLSINELLLAFLKHAEDYYLDRSAPLGSDGRHPPSKELANIKYAIRRLQAAFGTSTIEQFDALALESIQARMADEGLARGYINSTLNRIRRVFRWGVRKKLVKAVQLSELQSVEALKRGRTNAREPEPKEPVADEWVEATLPFLSRQVAAMVKLQRLTGMRSDELCRLRACDIDCNSEIWLYELDRHKTSHKGKRRVIPLGPQARLILQPFLPTDREKFLFSPQDAVAERADEQRAKRKTRVQPSQQNRRKKIRKRAPGERYTTGTYRNAVRRAVLQANRQREKESSQGGLKLQKIPNWHPYQLRHAHSTRVRQTFGEEAAQVSLGHSRMDTTAIYGEKNLKLAIDVARKLG